MLPVIKRHEFPSGMIGISVDRGPVQSREYGYCGVMGAQEIVDFLEPGRYRSVTIF